MLIHLTLRADDPNNVAVLDPITVQEGCIHYNLFYNNVSFPYHKSLIYMESAHRKLGIYVLLEGRAALWN